MARLLPVGTTFGEAVAWQVELYRRFAARGGTFLHDPLAAALIVRPDLAAWETRLVEVETQGRLSASATLMRRPKGLCSTGWSSRSPVGGVRRCRGRRSGAARVGRHASPASTTVRLPWSEMSAAAVEPVVGAVGGERLFPVGVRVPVALRVWESTAKERGRVGATRRQWAPAEARLLVLAAGLAGRRFTPWHARSILTA